MALPDDSIGTKKENKQDTSVVTSINPSNAESMTSPQVDASSPPSETEEAGKPWGAILAAIVISAFVTYLIMMINVVSPLEEQVLFERSQKVSYMTSNQLDFNTLEPRVRELEASNAAKSRKEAVLIQTIEQLSSELEKLTAPFEDVAPE